MIGAVTLVGLVETLAVVLLVILIIRGIVLLLRV